MREIKLRAIVKSESTPRDIEGVSFTHRKVAINIAGCVEWREYKKLIQYTGLKDKNGAEIYEGDIMLCEDGAHRQIIFSDGCFGFKGALSSIVHQGQFEAKFMEIIGNIYENPELLKAEA